MSIVNYTFVVFWTNAFVDVVDVVDATVVAGCGHKNKSFEHSSINMYCSFSVSVNNCFIQWSMGLKI